MAWNGFWWLRVASGGIGFLSSPSDSFGLLLSASVRSRSPPSHRSLLDAIATELLYVAPYPEARRLYLAQLPALVAQLGLRVCCQLAPLLKAICHLLSAEVETACAAVADAKREGEGSGRASHGSARSPVDSAVVDGAAHATRFEGARDGLRLLHCVLRHAWPRAATHASLVARHALAAHLRTAVALHGTAQGAARGAARGAADAAPLFEEATALLRLLGAAGARDVCARAIDVVRSQTKGAAAAAAPLAAATEAIAVGLA